MLIKLGLHVDIMLRPAQRVEVALHVFQIGVSGHQMTDHKRRVNDLAKAQLLDNIERRAEKACRWDLAVYKQSKPVQEQTGEVKFNFLTLKKFFQTLQGRIV